MGLSSDLISQFVKVTKDEEPSKSDTIVYGTVRYNDRIYVQLDGSDLLTPVSTTADVKDGERVTVLIKNHTATITGNISSPSARTDTVKELGSQISEFEVVVADKISTKQLAASIASIKTLLVDDASINELIANGADIDDLNAKLATIEQLEADIADIDELIATSADVSLLEAKYALVENLEASTAEIYNLISTYGKFESLVATNLEAVDADIKRLNAEKLDAESAELTYANIDFSNIGDAAITHLFSDYGLIKDIIVEDGTISGELIGVTIKGDLIEGNTVKADKLVVKGSDGLYYKLNIEAGTFAGGEEVPTDSLHGSVITAQSITADKVTVSDLVAFGATIGGFNISENSIYSGVKSSVDNTTRGIYMDNDGQIAFGDANNFIKYYKDTDGTYKLAISSSSILLSSTNETVEETITSVKNTAESAKDAANEAKEAAQKAIDEATVSLRIDSSRGTVFKNNSISTVLSAVIYKGPNRITDIDTLHSVFGSTAYLEWKWQRIDEETFGTILSTDSRIGNDGFTFTLSPDDVDTKVTFMCNLIV